MSRFFKWYGGWILPFALSVILAAELFRSASARGGADFEASLAKLKAVNALIQDRYVRPVDSDRLLDGALRGMLGALDEYCVYFSPKEFQEFMEDTRGGGFGGLGIEIALRQGMLTVLTPIEDTPAARAGILPGDVIAKIDGESTEGITLEKAVTRLRGKEGTKVTLHVFHRGAEAAVDIAVVRAIIHVKSVKDPHFADPEGKIGYIRVTAFQEQTTDDFRRAYEKLQAQGLRALVVDLRFNPGGLLDEAVSMADLFVDDGVIVTTQGRRASDHNIFRGKKDGTLPRLPLAVLVNETSASASEIFSGAIRDHGLGKLVGTRTYGKGSVQSIVPLKEVVAAEGSGAGLKLTTAYYFTPRGTQINREEGKKDFGLEPDIVVDMTEAEEAALLKHRREVERPEPPVEPSAVQPRADPATPGSAPGGSAAAAAPAQPFVDKPVVRAVEELRRELGLPVAAKDAPRPTGTSPAPEGGPK